MTYGRRGSGFTLIELLIVIGIVGILSAVAVSLYVDWRANTRIREVVTQIERSISMARQDAKRLSTDVTMTIPDDGTQYAVGGTVQALPAGVTLSTPTAAGESVTFSGVLGVQEPFATVTFDVTTGTGAFGRTATVSIVPPLGKTGVVQ